MRITYLVGLVLTLVLGLVLSPSHASAQGLLVCQVNGFDAGRPMLECHDRTPCTADATCVAAMIFDDAQCAMLPGTPGFCAPGCGTLFGCENDSDCPTLRGTAGRCEGTGLGDGFAMMCRYTGAPNLPVYCSGPGSGLAMSIGYCHRRPDGSYTANWYEGNCDGDGCPNGSDARPCDADPDGTSCSIRMDLGPVCDSPAPVMDGGVVTDEDAGAPTGDAGMTIPPPEDSGPSVPSDGGPTQPMDAGTVAPPGTSFSGGGGCTCAAAGHGHGGALPLALALVGMLGVVWRRRR